MDSMVSNFLCWVCLQIDFRCLHLRVPSHSETLRKSLVVCNAFIAHVCLRTFGEMCRCSEKKRAIVVGRKGPIVWLRNG
jgi:hypothetical protein